MGKAWERWAEQAYYDLDTAKAMLDSGRLLYVLFCCQQAVEKMLKGMIAEKTQEYPPRLHDLLTLAERAGLELDPITVNIFRLLTSYYSKTRYPHELQPMAGRVDRDLAEECLGQTEEVLSWLKSQLR
jgi:HEPN domain-containing protein